MNSPNFSLDEIIAIREKNKQIVEALRKNKNWGCDKDTDWELFANTISLLPPQSYGFRVQNKIINEFNFTPNKPSDGIGDFHDANGVNYEFKVSLLSHSDSVINFVQIRPHHNTNYFLVILDIRDKFKLRSFILTPEEMEYEIEKMATFAHGLSKHDQSEYRISLTPDEDNKHYRRWINNYERRSLFNTKKKSFMLK